MLKRDRKTRTCNTIAKIRWKRLLVQLARKKLAKRRSATETVGRFHYV